jgi:hypothetical protein
LCTHLDGIIERFHWSVFLYVFHSKSSFQHLLQNKVVVSFSIGGMIAFSEAQLNLSDQAEGF